jgi:DNA-binding transcriptional LysR family regulator
MTLLSRSVKAFITVAEELHFGRAAQRLHMSQPPLSQQIREFENAVGAALFLRTTRSVQLTPAGKLMLERSRQLVADANEAVHAARQLASGETGSMTLGFTHSTVYRVLPQVLVAFRAQAPGVRMDLKQYTSDVLIDGLRAGRIDVALARLSRSMMEDFEVAMVARDPMVLVMPADHPLAALRAVPLKALHGLPFIGYSQDGARYFHELVESIFAVGGVRPEVKYASILPTLLALVEAGMGLALVPESAASSRSDALQSRPLVVPGGRAEAVLYSAWRRDNANPAVAAFVAMLPAVSRKLEPPRSKSRR